MLTDRTLVSPRYTFVVSDVFDDHQRPICGAKSMVGGSSDVLEGLRSLKYAFNSTKDGILSLLVEADNGL